MAADPKALSPKELAELLASLDNVMADAKELRRTITQQLAETRANDQPRVSKISNRRRRPRPDGN